MYQWRNYSAACALGCTILFLGCSESGPKLHIIKGKVTHNGKPIPNLYITFTPDDQMTKAVSTGVSDTSGYFEMKISTTPGVYPGPHTVSAHDPLIDFGSKTSSEPDYLAVTAKYAPGKSPLKMDIQKNEHNLELKLD